jgi:GTPase SAR1 family protein
MEISEANSSIAVEDVISINVAVIGAKNVGKTTLAGNFMKGYIGEEEEKKLNLEDLMHPADGKYEVDLDYNNQKYHITIQEQNIKQSRGAFLDKFDGVIYMFACDEAESFVEIRQFFIMQIASENELKPRIAVGNKLDLVTDDDIKASFVTEMSNYVTKTGSLNLKEARRWVNERMWCDYAEVTAEDPANVDEIFCLLIDIIEKSRKQAQPGFVSYMFNRLKSGIIDLFDYMTFLQTFLGLLSFFGIIGLGGGFYSGTNLEGYTDDNWVYVVMLFLGIFSFIAGVVGFYGAKHRSKEYLTTVSIPYHNPPFYRSYSCYFA